MEERITISGMGGQGIISLGNLLAYSGMHDGKHVSVVPSYGAEMRGGISNSFVILSDKEIGSPVFTSPHTAILMYQLAIDNNADKVKKNGLIIYNEDMVINKPARKDVKIIGLPANVTANKLGNLKVANVIMAGAWCKLTATLNYNTVIAVIKEILFVNKKQAVIDVNLKAFDFGYNFV